MYKMKIVVLLFYFMLVIEVGKHETSFPHRCTEMKISTKRRSRVYKFKNPKANSQRPYARDQNKHRSAKLFTHLFTGIFQYTGLFNYTYMYMHYDKSLYSRFHKWAKRGLLHETNQPGYTWLQRSSSQII